MTFPSFDRMMEKLNRQIPESLNILSFDPGETTGWAWVKWQSPFESSASACGQESTSTVEEAVDKYMELIAIHEPDIIVIEEYRIYSHKSDQHKWSDVVTLRLIGALECLAYQERIPVFKQMAVEAKAFCTDEKLDKWGLFHKGVRHGRDAMRHACHFILFNKAYDGAPKSQ